MTDDTDDAVVLHVGTAPEPQTLECPRCCAEHRVLIEDTRISGTRCQSCGVSINYQYNRDSESGVDETEQTTLVPDGGQDTETYQCPNDDCDYVGPAGTRDYYGAHIYVCRRCGHEIPEADPDKLGGGSA